MAERLAAAANAVADGTDPVELMRDAIDAVEPGTGEGLGVGEVVSMPSADSPAGVFVDSVDSAGYKIVYHTISREPSVVSNNMLEVQLNKKINVDGREIYAFTTKHPSTWSPPAPPPIRGTLLCVFHKDHELHDHYQEVGVFPLPTNTGYCRKSNLMTVRDVQLHAEHRHKNEWGQIEQARLRSIEEEERAIRRLTLENAQRERDRLNATVAPAPVIEQKVEPVAPTVETSVSKPDDWTASAGECYVCDWTSKAVKSQARRTAWYKHKKNNHPELS